MIPVASKQQSMKLLATTVTKKLDHYTGSSGCGISQSAAYKCHIDSIKDMDKIAGIEEVLQNISSIKKLREKRVLSYLNCLDNQFLFQKIGYIFSYQKERLGISDDFLRECQSKIGKSKRYLSRDITNGVYDSTWKLIVPENLSLKNGVIEDATI